MRQILFITLAILFSNLNALSDEFNLKSPSGEIIISISANDNISYSVKYKGNIVLNPSTIAMQIDNNVSWGVNSKISKKETGSKTETISPVVPRKFEKIESSYNFLKLYFKGNYQLEFRAYNDGVAYRWATDIEKDFKVTSEDANFTFSDGDQIYFPKEESMHSHQERLYKYLKISDVEPGQFCSTGALADLKNGVKVYISESDLFSYPGMFLEKSATNPNAFKGKFAGYPLETNQTNDRNVKIIKYADYIAQTKGSRTFPWRLMIITDNDANLLTSELVYKLASPNRLKDVSWIKPGKVAWDWWNANNIYGIDFKSGVNTETYKYFIDFASKYGLQYVILDEGWYHLEDVLKVKQEIDINELVKYGKEKNVGIILWVTWKALDDKLDEALKQFKQWDVKGIKVDFMQRDDQWMVEYYERVSQKAADYQLLVDFHGAYKPTGLNVTYPNVITSEGVVGLEHCKWSENANPEHNLTLPFIRMVAGPMDYTPGAMINATKQNFRIVFTEPMSPTTRCHQLAMYVVFESPLQMLADNPSNYLKEPVCMEFLSTVPTVWNETRVLQAKVSDYIVLTRKNANKWYIAAMTDLTERNFVVDLGFLPEGKYRIDIWQDGINADKHASDFKKISEEVTNKSKLNIHLTSGGGWVAIVSPIE
ncbi:MAG: glycoside hydrolase family 97 protein [Bacteroidales bacterium]|nr:MAG: glycoside hydrolase family 97 protein [Bacteroidales bacterium]